MIGYVTLGTCDIARAAAFYDRLLGEVGAKRFIDSPRFIAWSTGRGKPWFAIALPYDGEPAHRGNGLMTGLLAADRAAVARLHALALELGGSDEGAPGERVPGFYAGYFRDLDGNKLNIHYMGA
ncbi:VOC family protein [Arenimonas daejeonensis]|uniref:VOC family protein n=1 Tax=Arenimonas daejeonensis TaxID=370777 RepID=UPI0011BF9344|nr:VOC family protein [Arenimonas daejeonensis]